MRPDPSRERGTDRYLHFLSPLSFRPPCNNKEMEKATRGKNGGERPFTQRTPEKGSREHLAIRGRGKRND